MFIISKSEIIEMFKNGMSIQQLTDNIANNQMISEFQAKLMVEKAILESQLKDNNK
jgi:hypothetical protein